MYIDYNVFCQLYEEAGEYTDEDMYIAERGWQEWMDHFDVERVVDILKCIYAIKRMSLRQIRDMLHIPSRPAMSREFRIPLRTLENWESGSRNAPEHEMLLIYYVAFLKNMNGGGEGDD